jgi:Ca2+/Na+ antiporter
MNQQQKNIYLFLASKKGGWLWLLVLLILFVTRVWMGHCTLWLCVLFVATVVIYTIFTNKIST